eukprot:g5040.t1
MTAAEDSPIEGDAAFCGGRDRSNFGVSSGKANSSDPADAPSVVSGTAPAATEASAQPDGVSAAGAADATPAVELRSQMGTSQPSGRVHPTLPVPLAAASLSETVTNVQPPIPCPVNFGHPAVWDSLPRDVQASFVADSAQPPIPCPGHFGHPAFWDSLPREVQAGIASDAGRADACISARLTLAEETARLRREEDLRMQIQLQTLHRRSADITARLASLTREDDDDHRAEQELMQRRAAEDAARAALQQQRAEAIALTRSDLAAIASATAEATLERDSVLSSRASSAASSPRIRAVSSGMVLGADPSSFPASAPSQPVLAASAPAPSQPVSAASAPASSQPVLAASAPAPSQPALAASAAAPSAPVDGNYISRTLDSYSRLLFHNSTMATSNSMVMTSIQESCRKMLEDISGTEAPGDWEEMAPVYHSTLRDLIKCVSALSRVRADVSATASGGMMGVSMSARDYSTSVLSTTQTPDMSVVNNMPPPPTGGMNVLPGRLQGRSGMVGGGVGGGAGVGGPMAGGMGPMSSSLRAMPAGGRAGMVGNSNVPQPTEKVVVRRRRKKAVSTKSSSATPVPVSEGKSGVGSSKNVGGPEGIHTVRRVKRRDPPSDAPLIGVATEVGPSTPQPPPPVPPPAATESTVPSSPPDDGMASEEEERVDEDVGNIVGQLEDEVQEGPSNSGDPEEDEDPGEEAKDDHGNENDTTGDDEVRVPGNAEHDGYAIGEVRDTAGGDQNELIPRTVPEEWEDMIGASPEMQQKVAHSGSGEYRKHHEEEEDKRGLGCTGCKESWRIATHEGSREVATPGPTAWSVAFKGFPREEVAMWLARVGMPAPTNLVVQNMRRKF